MLKLSSYIIIFISALSCASSGSDRNEKRSDTPDDLQAIYDKAVDRLTTDYLEDNWVVSRDQDGSTEHEGDSLLWTGLAMASLSCEKGDAIENRMIQMFNSNSGAMVRYEPLGEYANGREITFDGATGLYYGVYQRLRNCNTHDKWRDTWKQHTEYLKDNDYVLHPNVTATVLPQFNAIRDYISYMLDQGEEPSKARYRGLEAQAITWSSINIEARKPCFPVHLSFLYLSFLEDSDNLLAASHEAFCYATEEANLPIIDHWCARRDIIDCVENEFQYNQWEYRQQRCSADNWETPDGNGLATPAIDLIFSIWFAYPEVVK